jgi:hypothetical protein
MHLNDKEFPVADARPRAKGLTIASLLIIVVSPSKPIHDLCAGTRRGGK